MAIDAPLTFDSGARGPAHREQSARNRLRERAKLALRVNLMRLDLDLQRDPWTRKVARMATAHGITTVLDVGANVGQFGELLRRAGYAGDIVSIEPLRGAYAELAHRSADDPRWCCLNKAVGADGPAVINISQNSYSSSFRPMTDAHLEAAPDSRYIGTEEVEMVSIDSLLSERSIRPEQTLLKIDTQGFESEVLDSAGAAVDGFAAVQVELSLVELYAGQKLMPELVARLEGLGLTMFAVAPGFSGATGRMLQMDALFVRNPK